MKNFNFRNQQGIALLQTLFLAAGISFFTYYLMDLGNLLNRVVSVNILAESLRDFRSKVSLVLSDTNSCLSTVVDFSPDGKILKNKTQLNAIKIKSLDYSQNPPGLIVNDLFPVGSVTRGLEVLEYTLSRVQGEEGAVGVTRLYSLEVKLRKSNQKGDEAYLIERFDIYASEIAGQIIVNCYANSSENKLARYFCQNSLGGMIYEHIGVKGGGHCIVEGKYIAEKLQDFYGMIVENESVQEQNEYSIGDNKAKLEELNIEVKDNATKLESNNSQLVLEQDFHL